MTSCCSRFGDAAEQQFNKKKASQELARYRQKGPGPTTRLLEDGVTESGALNALNGLLLDVGSAAGAVQERRALGRLAAQRLVIDPFDLLPTL